MLSVLSFTGIFPKLNFLQESQFTYRKLYHRLQCRHSSEVYTIPPRFGSLSMSEVTSIRPDLSALCAVTVTSLQIICWLSSSAGLSRAGLVVRQAVILRCTSVYTISVSLSTICKLNYNLSLDIPLLFYTVDVTINYEMNLLKQ